MTGWLIPSFNCGSCNCEWNHEVNSREPVQRNHCVLLRIISNMATIIIERHNINRSGIATCVILPLSRFNTDGSGSVTHATLPLSRGVSKYKTSSCQRRLVIFRKKTIAELWRTVKWALVTPFRASCCPARCFNCSDKTCWLSSKLIRLSRPLATRTKWERNSPLSGWSTFTLVKRALESGLWRKILQEKHVIRSSITIFRVPTPAIHLSSPTGNSTLWYVTRLSQMSHRSETSCGFANMFQLNAYDYSNFPTQTGACVNVVLLTQVYVQFQSRGWHWRHMQCSLQAGYSCASSYVMYVTDTISWRGHHDRVMQLNRLYFCGICQMMLLKVWSNTALGCNHQSICMPQLQPLCSAALVPNVQPRRGSAYMCTYKCIYVHSSWGMQVD